MPPEDIGIAQDLERQGYFARVPTGDQKAASLFARLFASTANPEGRTDRWGWLTKQPGETQVGGWAEDAVVWGNDPNDLNNVVDLVIGAGAPGASLTSTTVHTKPRRPGNKWSRPLPLTPAELNYLKSGGGVPVPTPPADPCASCKAELAALKASSVPKAAYPGDHVWDQFGAVYLADVQRAGQTLNAQSFRWAGRTMHDDYMEGLTLEQSIAKHRAEWCAVLGIPVV